MGQGKLRGAQPSALYECPACGRQYDDGGAYCTSDDCPRGVGFTPCKWVHAPSENIPHMERRRIILAAMEVFKGGIIRGVPDNVAWDNAMDYAEDKFNDWS